MDTGLFGLGSATLNDNLVDLGRHNSPCRLVRDLRETKPKGGQSMDWNDPAVNPAGLKLVDDPRKSVPVIVTASGAPLKYSKF